MITTIFYHADEFCKDYVKKINPNMLPIKKNRRCRKSRLSLSEITTICICFHFMRLVITFGICVTPEQEVDGVICLLAPEHFLGVGGFYQEFAQTEDKEVERLLREFRR